jgi:tRNA uridine 5-carboxymethylaminomethyl modification enzyme
LSPIGHEVGLIEDDRLERVRRRLARRDDVLARLGSARLIRDHDSAASVVAEVGELPSTALELLRRPNARYDMVRALVEDQTLSDLSEDVAAAVWIRVAYEGYLEQQERLVSRARRMEGTPIPPDFDLGCVPNLRTEAREKLLRFRPTTLGQAGRLAGVSPADISVLMAWLYRHRMRSAG